MTTRKGTRATRRDVPRAMKPGGPVGRVRKNMDMDATKLRAAQEALGTKTETETVDRALDLVLGRARFDAAFDRIAKLGGINVYDAR